MRKLSHDEKLVITKKLRAVRALVDDIADVTDKRDVSEPMTKIVAKLYNEVSEGLVQVYREEEA